MSEAGARPRAGARCARDDNSSTQRQHKQQRHACVARALKTSKMEGSHLRRFQRSSCPDGTHALQHTAPHDDGPRAGPNEALSSNEAVTPVRPSVHSACTDVLYYGIRNLLWYTTRCAALKSALYIQPFGCTAVVRSAVQASARRCSHAHAASTATGPGYRNLAV